MIEWDGKPPKTFKELFAFYHGYLKPLYSEIQVSAGHLSQETLFEMNAALDHISRFWAYGQDEATVVDKAYGHFKRACLDIFKIHVDNSLGQYQELTKVDIGLIDNGEFKRNLLRLHHEIIVKGAEARRIEGAPDTEMEVPAFECWQKVFELCNTLREDFYINPNVEWARIEKSRIEKRETIRTSIISFIIGIITGLIGSSVYDVYVKPQLFSPPAVKAPAPMPLQTQPKSRPQTQPKSPDRAISPGP